MSSFIIRDVRIFTGEQVIPDGYALIEDGKVKSVGPSSSAPDESIPTISKPGHTLIPGLIDTHIHANGADPRALPQSLRFGVTTVCEMHNEVSNVPKLREQSKLPDTADYKTAGQSATVEDGWPIPVIKAHDKRPEMLEELATWPKLTDRQSVIEYLEWNRKEMKNDYVKLMHESGTVMGQSFHYPSVELQKIIVEEAHKRGFLTVAHATCVKDTLEVLEAGVNGLTHTIVDQPPTQELVDAYKKNNAWLNPTLAAMGSLTTEGLKLQERFAHDERVTGLMEEEFKAQLCACMAFSKDKGKVEYAYESVRLLKNAGIDIVCGSDSAGPAVGTAFGATLHQELYLYVHEVGMTPEEALRSATSVPAKRFRFSDRGIIAEGLKADLVLVEGNPLEDIDATLNLRGVWRDGVLCTIFKEKVGGIGHGYVLN